METLFLILLFGWAMAVLFLIAQILVMVFDKEPSVFKWRRAIGKLPRRK